MVDLEKLPAISESVLHGLQADDSLKQKILYKAANSDIKKTRSYFRYIPAVCCAVTLILVSFIFLKTINSSVNPEPPTISTIASGSPRVITPVSLHTVTDIGEKAFNTENVYIAASDVSSGIWSRSHNGYFPLVLINDKAYRLISDEYSVIGSADLDGLVGSVRVCSAEPGIEKADGILSNILESDTNIYNIKGTNQSLIAAAFNQKIMVFQRAGFNGKSIINNEQFKDTVVPPDAVNSLDIPGYGLFSDEETVKRLYNILYEHAVFENSGSVTGNEYLIIGLKNGLSEQLAVKGNKLYACGTWSCPEFWDEVAVLCAR